MKSAFINHIRVFAPKNKNELLKVIENANTLLIAINAEKILKRDSTLKNLINNNIGYPDGIGAVLALRQKGLNASKIAGAEFWYDIVKYFHKSKSFYLIGGTEDVIKKTVTGLKNEFNDIKIKGFRNGFLSKNDEEELINIISETKPDIIFVAMGTPRQELLMQKLKSHHPALYMGLGGSFDIYSGLKKRAPKLFINLGLEWFYRLIKEPQRIYRQTGFLKFLLLLLFRRF